MKKLSKFILLFVLGFVIFAFSGIDKVDAAVKLNTIGSWPIGSKNRKFHLSGLPSGSANGGYAYCFDISASAANKGTTSSGSYKLTSTGKTTLDYGKRLCALYTANKSGTDTNGHVKAQLALWMIQAKSQNKRPADISSSGTLFKAAQKIYNSCKNDSDFKVAPKISVSSIMGSAVPSGGYYTHTVTVKHENVDSYNVKVTGVAHPTVTKSGNNPKSFVVKVPETDVTKQTTMTVTVTGAKGPHYYLRAYAFKNHQPMGVLFKETSTAKDTSIKTTLNPQYYKVNVKKTDASTGKVLTGATFGLYSNSTCTTPMTISGKARLANVNSSGIAEFLNLVKGNYYIKETKAPTGYNLNSECKKAVLGGTITISNTETLYPAKIKKTDASTGKVLTGATFGLYSNSTCTTPMTISGKARLANVDENGIAEFKSLSKNGSYYVKETKAPTGYSLNPECKKLIVGGEVTISNKKNDTPSDSKKTTEDIVVMKVDANSTDVVLPGAEFELYSDATCHNKISDAKTTGEDGKLTFTNVSGGEYYIKETKEPEGYKKIDNCMQVKANEENVIVNKKVYELKVKKVDVDDKKILPGATVEVYEGSECSGKLLYNEILENGEATFMLEKKGDYSVKETISPGGYYNITDPNKLCQGVQVNGEADVTFENKKIICERVNNEYYDKNGEKVDEQIFKESCDPKKCETEVVNGETNYYNDNGQKTDATTYGIKCSVKKCEIEEVNGETNYYDSNGQKTDAKKYEEDCVHICKKIGSSYYDDKGEITTEENYMKKCNSCRTITDESGKTTYYDDNGKVVEKAEFEEKCVKNCRKIGNIYYGIDGTPLNSAAEYEKECSVKDCKVIDGKYYDSSGDETKDINKYNEECVKKCRVIDGKYYDSNEKEVNEKEYNEDCHPKCKIKDNKYYNKDGKEVKKEEYEKSCNFKCDVFNNKYYNKDGKEVKKEEYEKDCKSCKILAGKYYNKEGKEVSVDEYNSICNPKCEVIKGNYYDKNGKPVTAKEYKKACNPKCEHKNGKYYDKNGNPVSRTKYEESCNGYVATPSTGSPLKIAGTIIGVLLILAPVTYLYKDQLLGFVGGYFGKGQ